MIFKTTVEGDLELPDKIKANLHKSKIIKGDIVFYFKTAYKPEFNLPTVWLLMYSDGIMLCTTHKTRGIFNEIPKSSINSICFHEHRADFKQIVILSNDINVKDFPIRIPCSIDMIKLAHLFIASGVELFKQ